MNSEESDPPSNGNYSLEVENFGPIVSANVEFRPLTVFVGPSNTGKSYLAILVYVLHRCFGSYGSWSYDHRSWFALERGPLNHSVQQSLAAWILTLQPDASPPPLPRDVAASVRLALERPEGFARRLEADMRHGFGVDHGGDLVRRVGAQTSARVGLQIPQGVSRSAVQYEFRFGRRTTRASANVADELIGPEAVPREYMEDLVYVGLRRPTGEADLTDRDLQYGVGLLLDALFASLVRPLAQSAFYLPASRTGVMNTHQALVSALIRDATRAGIEPTPRVGRLAGVIADFLDQVVRMPSGQGVPSGRGRPPGRHRRPRTRRRRELRELADGLEDRILSGAVRRARSETGYPVFAYRPRGWEDDLPLMRTSSMVSELAPLVLYLRYIVQPGDVLIIEEPESHLHPEKQAELVCELARVVHAGVRIILTTHSEWVVEQISNLVRLSELPAASRVKISGADVALGRDQVGVWRFTESKRPKGSVVEEVVLDPDTGLFPTGYDEVSEALYNESAQTFNRLQESAGA